MAGAGLTGATFAAVLRTAVDQQIRPGQLGTSVVAHRLPRQASLGTGNCVLLNHRSADQQATVVRGRYARARFGTGRYGA